MIARMSREPSTRYSSSPYFSSVPPYLENTTLSPTLTSTGMRSPLSSKRPAPTATTSPSWGFSLAVSGMTRPEAVVCSASSGLTTTRSSRGLMETDMRLSLLHEEMTLREYLGSGIPVLVVVAVPTGGEIPSDSRWHARPSPAKDANDTTGTRTRATRHQHAGPGPPDARCRHPWGRGLRTPGAGTPGARRPGAPR